MHFSFQVVPSERVETRRKFTIFLLERIVSRINSSPCLNSLAVKLSDIENSFHLNKTLESLFLSGFITILSFELPSVYRLLISLRFNEDESFAKFESRYGGIYRSQKNCF